MELKCLVFPLMILSMIFLHSPRANGFSLLSGHVEARLDISPNHPNVTFHWDGSSPTFTYVEELGIPEFLELSDEQIMERLILRAFHIWNHNPGSYIQLNLQKPFLLK